MTEPLLQVRDLAVEFPTDDGVVRAVRGVSFDLNRGEVLGIVGESGCGKSVTNLAIMGLLPRTARVSGSVTVGGTEVIGRFPNEMREIRGKRIAMIFQDPMTSLNPVYTVGWQLVETIRAHNPMKKTAARVKAVDLLRLVGIPNPDDRFDSYPHEFSGGMRQRVVIAMAIANDPEVLIADEPTTALDVTVQAQILDTLQRIRRETGTAIVFITHDLGVLAGIADRLLVMYAGRVVESGPIGQVFDDPQMPYTIGLLGAIPGEDSHGRRLNQIKGAPPSLMRVPDGCLFAPRCPLAVASCSETEPSVVRPDEAHGVACHRVVDIREMGDRRSIFQREDVV
jgi:peptide/nickel transport system ATP-binding protein